MHIKTTNLLLSALLVVSIALGVSSFKEDKTSKEEEEKAQFLDLIQQAKDKETVLVFPGSTAKVTYVGQDFFELHFKMTDKKDPNFGKKLVQYWRVSALIGIRPLEDNKAALIYTYN